MIIFLFVMMNITYTFCSSPFIFCIRPFCIRFFLSWILTYCFAPNIGRYRRVWIENRTREKEGMRMRKKKKDKWKEERRKTRESDKKEKEWENGENLPFFIALRLWNNLRSSVSLEAESDDSHYNSSVDSSGDGPVSLLEVYQNKWFSNS